MGQPVDPDCVRCGLSRSRTQVVAGTGPARPRLALVGEAPGAEEDARGAPFVGRAGKTLDRALAAAGLGRAEVFITNAVKCRPPGNRRPSAGECSACRPFLEGEVERVEPPVVVALGKTAAEALLGRPVAVKAEPGPHAATVGGHACVVFVAMHPAAARFNRGAVESIAGVLRAASPAGGPARGTE